MPVIIRESIHEGKIVIRETTESYGELASLVKEEDLISASRFSNLSRRTEHISARAALREILPEADISYDNSGAPLLTNDPVYKYVSFSHCKDAAAVIVSENPCAVDIENLERDFSRASSKFVSAPEKLLPEFTNDFFIPAVWCAKEALYKYAGIPGLDFLRDLEIISANFTDMGSGSRGIFNARIKEVRGYNINIGIINKYIFCYISQKKVHEL